MRRQLTDSTTITALLAAAMLTAAPAALAVHPGDEDHAHAHEDKIELPSEEELLKGKLLVGDSAPAINVTDWVNGDPVTGFERGQVYVVEFWATWCGPCIRAIPHVNKLHEQYADKGVNIIGVTSRDPNNSLEQVKALVDSRDDMTYRVAFDATRNTMGEYRNAAWNGGIPHAFIVNQDGKLAWHGHPMGMDAPLAQVAAGTWDIERAAAAQRVEAVRSGLQEYLMPRAQPLITEAGEAFRAGDVDKALEVSGKVVEMSRAAFGDIAMWRVQQMFATGKTTEANAEARLLANESLTKYPDMLNRLAWMLATGGFENADLTAAATAAKQAVKLTKEKDPDIIDTLARVHAELGELDKAIEWQAKAVELATDEQSKATYQETLEGYRSNRG